jgi:uncharacterized phage-associated protein
MSVYPAIEVARWILSEATRRSISLSHMQLQKILYYAQGYSLGMSGEKLFDEPIMAWEHGPVVPEIYQYFRNFGANKITPVKEVEIPSEVAGIIDVVVSEKGQMSAAALRNATHEEMPYSTTPIDHEISLQKLEAFFVDIFWASDEEDAYEPKFESEEEERGFFRKSISEEEKKALIHVCSVKG